MNQLIALVICGIIGAVCYHYSKQRGRNPYAWLAIGILFGVFGLIALFVLPPLNGKAVIKKKGNQEPQAPLSEVKPKLETVDPTHLSKLWYYLDNSNQQFGPMSLDALSKAWHEGTVNQTTYVWNDLMENWKRLEEVLNAPIQPA